ncbi:MAG: HAD-IA family hydrolase [Alphaproteobacteria bacterium]|jgi:2-haloacid dehalogenase|nr:HAD-IA family hydrolase [Alphaproteobacteria bacterium]
MSIDVAALTFDTGGTILDWHSGVSGALRRIGDGHGLDRPWAEIANDYRRRSLKKMLNAGGEAPASFNIDDAHREELEGIIADHDLGVFTADEREALWRTWHELDAWPDFPAVLPKLRERYVVASFTILSVSLIVDTARRNGLSWDAVISCEMIGTYKLRPEAYRTAAKWLVLEPNRILMVACHNVDLDAARAVGFKTAFVRRPDEWGAEGPPDPAPNPACDIIADDFPDLARQLGVET